MHSWPMIVESMSATNRRFQRGFVRLDHDIDAVERFERPARRFAIAGKGEIGGVAFVDPVQEARLGIELAEQAERAVDQPVIEPSRCYQRRNGHRRFPSSRHRHRRPDRERQVGAWRSRWLNRMAA